MEKLVGLRQKYDISTFEPIDKGWSSDKKYRVETAGGQRMLLRVSDIAEYDRKKAEYGMMERVYNHGVLTSQPVDFGLCDDDKRVYSLSGWLDGEDAETALPRMSEAEQYAAGLKAGELLRKIHTLPAPESAEPWSVRFGAKVRERVGEYNSEPDCHCDVGEMLVDYLEKHRDVLVSRPQTFMHGDYNTENIIVMKNGEVGVIDFNSYNTNYGDPWTDLDNMAWMPTMFPYFYSGQMRGYFGGEPPADFWGVFAYYLAYGALGALACPYAINGIADGMPIVINILSWTDNFQNPVPTWYLNDFHVQYIQNTPIYLKKPFDFTFLENYGAVLKVVKHDKGAGNICFCIENNNKKYFMKFAGAPVENLLGCEPEQVVEWLKEAKQIYQDLAHENLIKLVKSEKVCGGYVNIFEWVDAKCIGYPNPSVRERFLNLPVEAKMQAFDDILDFHAHVAEKGYVAIDFYADQILYDFENKKTIICDIDFYQKSPYHGDKGTWGSSNFVSPEELTPGLRIDEITMVYTMGATAFCIFADYNRSPEAWTLSTALYNVAKQSVSDERSERQQSLRQFIAEWRAAKCWKNTRT